MKNSADRIFQSGYSSFGYRIPVTDSEDNIIFHRVIQAHGPHGSLQSRVVMSKFCKHL